ncbi:MAG: phytanoyl-CoA dioxygenase family protein [Lentisphaeria bacterium]|nr:phytanoyl-CoA dioxygenase family protein [Lentisphaeria bacterium]NQZ67558.1 phytanoyl-CoA dioxygenase family protein [Lentisphaeria bacterium]
MSIINELTDLAVEMGRESVDQAMIDDYRSNGFVKIPNLITRDCAQSFRAEALNFIHKNESDDESVEKWKSSSSRLNQHMLVWRESDVIEKMTKSKDIAAIAEQLSGLKLRLWHDHLLSKGPGNALATEWHQDGPYWPFQGKTECISIWIALQDTPEEHGCMSFIPGSHRLIDLPTTDVREPDSFWKVAPELEYAPKVQLPLKAGDATFHHGFTAHMGMPNILEDWRVAHVITYMKDGTKMGDIKHHVTETYKAEMGELPPGQVLNQSWFPRLTE